MRIADRRAGQRHPAGRRLDHRARRDPAGLERPGGDERLHRRARLEGVGERPVAQLRAAQVAAVGGRIARVVGQRQHLAGLRVEDDDAAGLGLVARRRRRGCAGRRRTAPSSRSPGRCRGRRPARTLSPMSSTTRPSRSLITRRVPSRPASSFWNASSTPSWPRSSTLVKPTTCAAASPSGYLRLYSRTSWMPLTSSARTCAAIGIVDLAAQPDEVRVVGEAALELAAGHVEDAGEPGAARRIAIEVLRDRPDRRRRNARREDEAVAIEDAAATGGQLDRVGVARLALLQEERRVRPAARRRPGRAGRMKPRPTSATRSLERQGGVGAARSGLVE